MISERCRVAAYASAILGFAVVFAACGTQATLPPKSTPSPCGTGTAPPAVYAHVIWIFMENKPYRRIVGAKSAPYVNTLAKRCGLASNYSAVAHPSLPNYIAATSGDAQGITDDDPPASHPLAVSSIYSQVTAAGKTWRDYEESAPANCPHASSGLYSAKHDPAPYYYTGIAVTARTGTSLWGRRARGPSGATWTRMRYPTSPS